MPKITYCGTSNFPNPCAYAYYELNTKGGVSVLAELREAVARGLEFSGVLQGKDLADLIAFEVFKVVVNEKGAVRSVPARRRGNGNNQLSLTEIAGGLSSGEGQ